MAKALPEPGPATATLGGYPATRIDFSVPDGLELDTCRLEGNGLQIWFSHPTDGYFVLVPDGIASVYIVDVGGRRQVFLTQHTSAASAEDVAQLAAIVESTRIGL